MFEKKIDLAFLPTPLHSLKNLSKKYPGYNLFIKRDDLTGLALGGNKTRKLEYLIYDALSTKSDTIITGGAQQSNHCRQTAAASSAAGLECHLTLGGTEPKVYDGNLLLSHLLGAKIYFTGENRKGEDIPNIKSDLEKKNKKCYVIPYGGSNATGAMGYVNAVSELKVQLEEQSLNSNIDYIFFASSSGGTLTGLILGLELFKMKTELMPVNIDKEGIGGLSTEEYVLNIVKNTSGLLNIKRKFTDQHVKLIKGYDSPGYGVVTDNEINAIKLMAESEGILLDPVYTGRAFHGMIDHINKKKLKHDSNILFWHTGGLVTTLW